MNEKLTQRMARSLGHSMLRQVTKGRLEVIDGNTTTTFGSGEELVARVEIKDPAAWTSLLRGSTGFADGYILGHWDTDDPVAVVRVVARSMPPLDVLRKRWHPLLGRAQRLAKKVPINTKDGSRTNIAAHYDLGNDLFEAFLDERLMYSCAYFDTPYVSLDDAQRSKLDRLCRQLHLGPDDHLVEIGTGWGGMAIYAAQEYGCHVTTTTISKEQRDLAIERVADAGLSDRVTMLDQDYRDLTGTYTKLVSIEMIEAVGWQYFETFFRKCESLLEPDGLMALQAITIEDDLYELEKASKSFANTSVFPGGCLPSERLIKDMIRNETDLRTIWIDDITSHYSETLRLWREKFDEAIPALEPHGYDERFQRMWRFYLAFSEGGFRERRIRDLQMVFAKPGFVPPEHARSEEAAVPA